MSLESEQLPVSEVQRIYREFKAAVTPVYAIHPAYDDGRFTAPHLFAIAFQLSRAFTVIYRYLIGISRPTQLLRARMWESIFTHSLSRYQRSVYKTIWQVPTLITGPSGVGKELVARAVGLSRYIPYREKEGGFPAFGEQLFFPLQLSALPSTLIESELFGHRKGAYTGAVGDRAGWLEQAGNYGSVFLDEIAEGAPEIQVKLLRVLESRAFSRMGETTLRPFDGKAIFATNRDLNEEIEEGRFREDLYFRLCADHIQLPTLAERLIDSPEEFNHLIATLLSRIVPNDEARELTTSIAETLQRSLPADYRWPGNVRELEQAVRAVMIHGRYAPPTKRSQRTATLPPAIESIQMSVDELTTWYVRRAFEKYGNYQEVGRRLGIDRRTVKARVSEAEREP